MKKRIANILVVVFALWFFQMGLRPKPEAADEFQVNDFAHLPVKYEGRKKPVDTMARNLLTILSGKQTVRNAEGEKVSATEGLLDNLAGVIDQQQV